MSEFPSHPTAVLENETIRLEYPTSIGPRILSLSYLGSTNLLGDAHDISWDTPRGKYFVLGGHRLWISPEIPEKTYIPDTLQVQIREIPAGVELTGPIEPGSGVRKSIRIELDPKLPVVRLTHKILNENTVPITIAPWAITMFRQGGTVILPQPVGNTDPHGLLHNRVLVLWPYTRLSDPRLTLRDDFILIEALPGLPPVKIGYANTAGWLAYLLDGILFRKSFDMQHPGVNFPDGGCNAESYCNDRFVELESLGSLAALAPGAATQLTETWELYPGLDVPFIPAEIRGLLGKKN
jgi:hypothetical protein